MPRVSSQLSDLQWVKQVRDLLIEVARASLADSPKLPESVSTQALPLAQKAQTILQKNTNTPNHHTSWQSQKSQWIEDVRQLLLELSRIALAERPKLPENIAQRALTLAETAQDIQEVSDDSGRDDLSGHDDDEADDSPPETALSVNDLFKRLKESLTIESQNSHQVGDAQWQQLLTLLDMVQDTYNRIPKS
ncbi:Inorganic pyrophosphatase [Planktothrix tepida]|uniref:Inorganic pyrophosphatase n=2 Tax=Planktothrix TaxID=54304 RepID=A0A1J1LNI2_9CYAN|nr:MULTISPECIES: hypothetical protein [Planktothrix]CAD5920749.1 Inorganic pyrophosphatase [Planktothrix pseudagardhii]CAD5981463.1 Inorganic pyrophosphatase [Planktothrix tepida]CUR33798.1 Inorganic pyrophosphatase [Planktothrix tepida PCC 9214]